MRRLILPAASLVLVTACSTPPTQRIESQALGAVRNQSVATTVRSTAEFTTMTAGNAMFGMLGAAAGISTGRKIVADNKVDDPANAIAAGLSQALQASQGAQPLAQRLQVDTDDVAQIANAAKGKARFVVDVKTISWTSAYFPFDWTHYRIMYAAHARLIDADTQKVLAQGMCKQVPETNDGAPTYEELFGNGAARMKTILATHAENCVASLKRDMLGMGGAAPGPTAAPAVAAQ